jgi:hypothetical protein
MDKPKIFCFSNVVGGGEGPAIAMAEDGTILGSHFCSHEGFARGDLGFLPGSRPDRHKDYAKHYPNGYEMVFVYADEIGKHEGLQAAFKLNQEQANENPN